MGKITHNVFIPFPCLLIDSSGKSLKRNLMVWYIDNTNGNFIFQKGLKTDTRNLKLYYYYY